MLKLKVGDIEIVCKFGLGFLGEYLETLDMSLQEMADKSDSNPYKWIPMMIYHSAKYASKEDLDYTLEELIDMLDSADGAKAIEQTKIAFIESLSKNVPKDNVKKEKAAPKKK